MESLESLSRKIGTVQDLLAVVKTMKSLAAVNIRAYERVVASLVDYEAVIQLAWHALFPLRGRMLQGRTSPGCVLYVVGSDQGMCGQFNEAIAQSAIEAHARLGEQGLEVLIWTTGERLRAAMLDARLEPQRHFTLPGSLPGITQRVLSLGHAFAGLREERGVGHFWLGHNQLRGQSSYDPQVFQVLPLADSWLERVEGERWPGRGVPLVGPPVERFFRDLFVQYLFVSLYRGLAQSMAAENAARLAAMQAAEKNIQELEEELHARHRDTRQKAITEELFDVIAGFEALEDEEREVVLATAGKTRDV